MHTEEDMLTSGPILSAFLKKERLGSKWEQNKHYENSTDGANH